MSEEAETKGRLYGRVAIVTGAGRGIGRSIALALGGEGAAVCAASRTLSEVEDTTAELLARGQRALAFAADVSDYKSAEQLVERSLREFGGVDILVNGAGILGPIGSLAENDIDKWVHTVNVNLIGTFFCCKAVLPHMLRKGYGRIVNLSGGGATASRPYFSAYAASKAAVVRLTETLADEVREHNIHVNAIAPGAVNTNMLGQVLAAGKAAGPAAVSEAQHQLETGGVPPAEAAALAVFLASDASAGLTGKLIAAPYDGWRQWDAEHISELNSAPWFTLRRIDLHTLRQFADKLT